MWPSRETAICLYNLANFFLVGSLVAGVVATATIVWMGNVKEEYLSLDLSQANKLAETAKATAATATEHAAALEVQSKQLQIDLEREHVARLELERKYGPRVLGDHERTSLAGAAKQNNVRHVIILRVDDMEAAIAADNLAKALESAGVKVDVGSMGTLVPPRYGASVYDPAGANGPFAKTMASIAPSLPTEGPFQSNSAVPVFRVYLKPFPQ